ncbi:hypothetical protein ABPG75_012813 [Micractinium tetrahymenae]
MQTPAGCGQLGAKCCPAELRPAGANTTEAEPYIGPFCYASDVICSAPEGSVSDSKCIPLPTNATCGNPGQDCCPSFYHTSVDKPHPDICAKGSYCADGNKCKKNPDDCGRQGKACCIVSTPSTTTTWCRQAGLYCPYKGSFPGTCVACPSPVPDDLQWSCSHPLAEDFSMPTAR